MKYTLIKFLIWIVFVVFFLVLLGFNLFELNNLKIANRKTAGEKEVLQMMYHLDKFQIALTEVASLEKPFLLYHYPEKVDKINKLWEKATSELKELNSLSGYKIIPGTQIIILDSLFRLRLKYSMQFVVLSIAGKFDNVYTLLNNEQEDKYLALLNNQYNSISNNGRNELKTLHDNQNLQSVQGLTILGFISASTFLLLAFIFWKLIQQTNAKERLHSEKELFEKIFEISSDSMVICDKDCKIIFCNLATERLFGKNRDKIIGQTVIDTFNSQILQERKSEIVTELQNRQYWEGEINTDDSEGNTIYFKTSISNITDRRGTPVGNFTIFTNISTLKKAHQALEEMSVSLRQSNTTLELKVKEQTALLSEVYDRLKDGVIATDHNFRITYSNSSMKELFGLDQEDMFGKPVFEVLQKITNKINNTFLVESLEKQEKISFNFPYPKNDKWFHVNSFPSKNGLSLFIKDYTRRIKADEEIQKSRRLYEFISKTNDLILYSTDADQMFLEICKIAVHTGNFLFSWIGLHESEKHIIKPVAWAGFEEGIISYANTITTLDVPHGRGPAGKAIREGNYIYCNDIENDPDLLPWKEESLKRGYRSVIALPIKLKGNVVGVFVLDASTAFYFTEEEIQLLVRVTDNISYALTNFEIDRKRKEAEKQLQKVSLAVSKSFSIIVITDSNGNIEFVNDAFTQFTGYSFEEAIGQNPRILKSGFTDTSVYLDLWSKLTNNQVWKGEFCNRTKNGEIYWEYAIITPILNEKGIITNYIAIKENITEKKQLETQQKELIKIIENTTAFVARVDLDGNFLYANRALKEIIGITGENIALLNAEAFRTESGKKLLKQVESSLYETGKWVGENSYLSRDGTVIPVLQVAILHKDENGKPTHISSTAIDLSKMKEIEKETVRLNKELRDLSNHLQNLSEIEKKDIAREIHDELGQGLTGLKLNASWIKRHIGEDRKLLEEKIDDLMEEVNTIIASFRRIYISLHPSMLEEIGLYGSIQWLVNTLRKTSGITIQFISDIEQEKISFDQTLAVYRVIQESLTNAIRYAGANLIIISLFKKDNFLILEIKDNGSGFDESKVDTHLHHGLLGMRERIVALNGEFSIQSVIGVGTTIHAQIKIAE